MPESRRKTAADRFRKFIHRSNELHAQYLHDVHFLSAYDRYTRWQLKYLLRYFTEIYAEDGYADAIDFIVSDLAGVGISDRDRDLEKVAPVITHTLPLAALETVANAAEANARVLDLNIRICRSLMVDDELPSPISEGDYFAAYREASSLEECLELVGVITGIGHTLKTLVNVPAIGMLLRTMRGPAHAMGFGALQEFLENGFRIFRKIPDIDRFLTEINSRMTGVFERIYAAEI